VARRPRWIAAFVFALVVAAGFAALGQWQVGRAVQQATVVSYPTETVMPISAVARPQHEVTSRAAGQMVSIVATRVPGDTYVVTDRVNFGVTGFWVIGHVVDTQGASAAVALGWAPTKAKADAAAAALSGGAPQATIVGRYQPSEPPDQEDFRNGVRSAVAIPELINQWKTATKTVYNGYIVAKTPSAGLVKIQSPKPTDKVTLDWLNVFYAIEWVVFAGFAVYLWYRLVKDAWEREQEDLEKAAAASASTADANSVRIN
jgi:cytochrome oxidase assembly protein ShyY1